MSWTDERVEMLCKLWMEGLSASRIAETLGGDLSRNAVIGKIHRLGLSHSNRSVPHLKKTHARLQDIEAPSTIPTMEDYLNDTPGHVTLADLKETSCRWPIGDPTSPDFHFCGDYAAVGCSYCATHAAMAYCNSNDRRRERAAPAAAAMVQKPRMAEAKRKALAL